MFYKTFLKNFAIFTGKHLCWSLFLIKLFSWEYYEIFKNTFFVEHQLTSASKMSKNEKKHKELSSSSLFSSTHFAEAPLCHSFCNLPYVPGQMLIVSIIP